MQLAHDENFQSARKKPFGATDRAVRSLILAAALIAVALVAMVALIAKDLRKAPLTMLSKTSRVTA